MDLGIKGKTALVTGSSSGIGRAIALSLAREGANIVVTGRDSDRVSLVASEVKTLGVSAVAWPNDLTVTDNVKGLIAMTVSQFGRLDILVNNAGNCRTSDPLTLSEDEFKTSMELMLFATLQACREAIPHMRERGWGRIINISSALSKQPLGIVDYDAIKAAVNMLTKDLANYLAKDNILVNAVCPGPIRTPLWERPGGLGDQIGGPLGQSCEEAMHLFAEQTIPLGHLGLPEDVADLVAFLASERAKFITGQAINVDGGHVKCII